jgi:hypothetical protein
MADDPRAQDRERPWRRGRYGNYKEFGADITQVDERVKQALSPVDDLDPFAQAVRSKDEMEQASKAWRKRRKT